MRIEPWWAVRVSLTAHFLKISETAADPPGKVDGI
jgi:hypothetical protein